MEDPAHQRRLAASMIYGHLEHAIQAGESVTIKRPLTPDQQAQMAKAFAQTRLGNLTDAKELLEHLYDYGQLRLFRAIYGNRGNEGLRSQFKDKVVKA